MTSRVVRAALVAVPVAFLAVFFVWPLLAIIARGLSAGAMVDVLTDPGLRSVAWFTLWQARCRTVVTLVVGVPMAYVVGRFRFPGRRVVLAFITVPFVLPTVVVGAAFLALLPDELARHGGRHRHRPRVLQLRRRRPHGVGHVGAPRSPPRGRRPGAGRLPVARPAGR